MWFSTFYGFRSAQLHNWLNRAAQPIIELRTSENYKLRYLTLISYFEATLKTFTSVFEIRSELREILCLLNHRKALHRFALNIRALQVVGDSTPEEVCHQMADYPGLGI